jgi:C1A family cysteine protease
MQLCAYKGPTRNQGNAGSCCGQAGAAKLDLDYRQFSDWPNRSVPPADFMASAEFVYICDLIADGNLGTDAGSSLHQTAITISQKGSCTNAEMLYSDTQFSTAPTAAQFAAGLLYRMEPYHFLPDLDSMKACLAPSEAGPGHSFIFGINVYDSFEGNWAEPGFMPVPNLSTESFLGGHAQHVIGFSDLIVFPDGSKGGLFVQNSWGDQSVWNEGVNAPGSTDGGCYWMPYEFVALNDPTNGPCVSDAWISHQHIWR